MRELHPENLGEVNVRPEIIGDHVIGFIFSNENLNKNNYLVLLQNDAVPTLAKLCLAQAISQVRHDVIQFQQYEAAPPYQINVRQYLDITFPNRWPACDDRHNGQHNPWILHH